MSLSAKKLKVSYLIGSLGIGGAEGQLLSLIKGLDRSKFEPSLTLFNLDTVKRSHGIVDTVFSLEIPSAGNSNWTVKGWAATMALNRFRKYMRSIKPDIVHVFLPAACILGCPAARLAFVPVIIGSRRSMVDCYRGLSAVAAVADKVATRFADFMLGNCEAVTREIIEVDGVAPDRAATIYNGVDTDRFYPHHDGRVRAQNGWSEQDVVLGVVANFIPYKRHIDFVRAAAIIRSNFSDSKFVMAGQDRGALPEIMAEIRLLKLERSVAIVPGLEKPEELYGALDIYVCSSETEGFSNVILEAMASGKPIVATDVGGNREAVVQGEMGFLVPPNSPQAIADAALKLIRNPDLRKEMGKRSRRRAESELSIPKMVDAHSALYVQLVGEAAGILN